MRYQARREKGDFTILKTKHSGNLCASVFLRQIFLQHSRSGGHEERYHEVLKKIR